MRQNTRLKKEIPVASGNIGLDRLFWGFDGEYLIPN